MRFIRSAIFIIAVLVFPAFSTFAQENEPQVVDEVIAQVNDGVITLSQVKREMKNAADSLVEQNKMTPEAATAQVAPKQGEIIANLINEELLLQKGKDSNIDSDVENQINHDLIAMMKDNGLKTVEALYAEMRKAGVNPDDVREGLRRKYTREIVMQNEVDRKLYSSFSGAELKKYYEDHKDKLVKPELLTISEIFLNFAGRDTDAVKAKAYQIVSQARNGGDFVQLAIDNSDRPEVKTDKGRVGEFSADQIKDINPKLLAPILATKTGGISDPVIIEEGIEIFKIDARKVASNEFDENMVRMAMTNEKANDERRKFLAGLRKEGFVKISENYRAMVMPFFAKDETTAEVSKDTKTDDKKTDSKKKNQ